MQTYIQVAIGLFGVACLVWAVIAYRRASTFLAQTTEVSGKVIRLEKTAVTGDSGSPDYAPVFTFATLMGQSFTVISSVAANPPEFTVGQTVRVRYDPSNPGGAKIHTFRRTWGAVVLSGAVGIFLVALIALRLLRNSH